ncbi:MAG: hypothetical protein KKA61_02485 [Nanoarchaeota archaeon]|nr:hypothetical protein [Nanoarchaeota archaeon]MBU4493213.1 hypothetical protein [Nanoarchaeota archaeon]
MKYQNLILGLFLIFLFSILVSAQEKEGIEEPGEIALTPCSTDADCGYLCQQELDACRIKSCYAKCENGACKEDIKYYYPDAELMLDKTKEFIVSNKGEDYLNEHFMLQEIANYTEGRGGTVGYELIFKDVLEEDLTFYSRFDFDICKEDISLKKEGHLFDEEDFKISRQKATDIAKEEGLKEPISMKYGISNYGRAIWIVTTEAEIEIGKITKVAIDMNGTIFYKSTKSPEIPETGELTPEPKVEEPPGMSSLYIVVGIGILTLIFIIYFLLKRKK